MVAEAAPLSAHVVKAFFTLFQVVLAKGQPFDVSFAGADERAKVGVAEFVETLKLRPLDVGGRSALEMTEVKCGISMGPGDGAFVVTSCTAVCTRCTARPGPRDTALEPIGLAVSMIRRSPLGAARLVRLAGSGTESPPSDPTQPQSSER